MIYNNTLLRKAILLAIWIFVSMPVSMELKAQTVLRLHLSDAIDTAMTNNKNIIRYKEALIQKEYLDKASVGNFFPEINVNGGYTYLGKNPEVNMSLVKESIDDMFGKYGVVIAQELDLSDESQQIIYDKITGGLNKLPAYNIVINQQNYPNLNITALQPIFLGGKIIAGKRFATAELETAKLQLEEIKNGVIQETVERYFAIVLLKEVIKTRQDVVDGMKKHEHQAQRAIDIGVIPAHELLRAKVAVANAERDLKDDQNKFELASMALLASLGIEDDFIVESIDSMSFSISTAKLADLQQDAKINQPIFRIIEQKRVMAQQKLALDRSEFLPQIAAWGEYGFFREEYPVIMPPFMVGIQANLKIFHGFSSINKIKATQHLQKEIDVAEKYANQQIDLLINKSYRQVLSLQERYVNMEPTVQLSKKNLEINEKRFAEGLSKSIDVIDAQLLYEASVVERLKSLYDYYVALANLYLASGNPEKVVGIFSNQK